MCHLRSSEATSEDFRNSISEFIQSGALLSLSNGNMVIGWGVAEFSSFPDPFKLNFYVSDFFLKEKKPWVCYPYWKEVTSAELLALLTPYNLPTINWSFCDKDLFEKNFFALQKDFEEGKLEKAVPYIFFKSSEKMNCLRLQQSLIQGIYSFLKKAGYLYGWWKKEEGFLGITPEFLFKHSSNSPLYLQTMALAGSCPSWACLKDFEKNSKEDQEHSIVVKGICQALQELGKITIDPREVLKLPNICHLLTPIHIHLNELFEFEKIVKQMHPTPALGAFPQLKGQQWLVDYDLQLKRKFFGAPFGVYDPLKKLSFCLVSIRQVQWNLEGMRIGAGCGVIKESHLEKEWQEIKLKLKTIQQNLAL